MSHTFVRLPNGDVEIDHIREMVAEIKDQTFTFSKWHPRPGLRGKKSGFVSHLYTGQKLDENFFTLDETGLTDDHCLICFKTIGSNPTLHVASSLCSEMLMKLEAPQHKFFVRNLPLNRRDSLFFTGAAQYPEMGDAQKAFG